MDRTEKPDRTYFGPVLSPLGSSFSVIDIVGSVQISPRLTGYGRVMQVTANIVGVWPSMAGYDRFWPSWPDMAGYVRIWPVMAENQIAEEERSESGTPSSRIFRSGDHSVLDIVGSVRIWPRLTGYGRVYPGLGRLWSGLADYGRVWPSLVRV
nr:hypothetical protein [Tanacetum cinerariifolium]